MREGRSCKVARLHVPKGTSRVRLRAVRLQMREGGGGAIGPIPTLRPTHAGTTAHESVRASHAAFQLIKSDSLTDILNKVRVCIDNTCCAPVSRAAQGYGTDDWKQLAVDIVNVKQVCDTTLPSALFCSCSHSY